MRQRIDFRYQVITRLARPLAALVLVLAAASRLMCVPAAAQVGASAGLGRACTGDCNHDAVVTIDELVTIVRIALSTSDFRLCPAGDADSNGGIEVNDVVAAVAAALHGCSAPLTPTSTATATSTPHGTLTPGPVCGNGRWRDEPPEQCDDGGREPTDGCDANCQVEPGFRCEGEPSQCIYVVDCTGPVTVCSGTPAPSPTPTLDGRSTVYRTPTPPSSSPSLGWH